MSMAIMAGDNAYWLGKVPADWGISRIGDYYKLRNEKVSDRDYPPLSVTMKGIVPQLATAAKTDDHDNRKLVKKGDFAINSRSDRRGSCGISDYDGSVSLINTVLTPRGEMNPRYYDWLFHTEQFADEFYKWGHGIVDDLWTTRWQEMKSILIVSPPLAEQQAIASYLDDRCSKLDEIITEAEKSIEEYTLYKQAIIAEVTTKGLNKNIPQKSTPYIWMGDIPFHWELKPFRFILKERNEKNNPVKSKERLSLSIDKGVTLYAEKTTNLDRFKDDFTAYKLAHVGDLVMNCMNMIVGASGVSKYYGCVSPVYYTYYDEEPDHITARYCEYLFRSRMLMRVLHSLGRGILSFDRGEDRVNTCRLKISRNDLRSLVLPVPPLEEQRMIVDYLTSYDKNIEALISEKQALIEDLQAYKKSLIYEVVTGKRRVV